MPDIKEVTVSTPTADELKEVNPTAILSSYKQDYKLKKEDDKTIDGKPAFIVNIYPEDRTKSYHRIEVIVEKSTYNIMSVSTYGKNGTDTAVKIKKYEKGQNFPDQIFVFDPKKYPEIEVIDLR
jgi:outer membrane lipoprotein-sorting protein